MEARAPAATRARAARPPAAPSSKASKAVKPTAEALAEYPPELPKNALLDVVEVLRHIPVSRADWYRGVSRGLYPKPLRFGRRTFWNSRDIAQLVAEGPKPRAVRAAPRRSSN